MRIGLMADTHDRVPAVDALLRESMKRDITFVLHARDYCSPFSLKPFQDHGIAMAGVFGRNDGDPEGIRAAAAQGMGQELFESPHGMTMQSHKVLVLHDIGEVVERSVMAHSVVVHGHTHLQEMKMRDNTLIGVGHNVCITTHDPSAHAEIVAMREAAAALGNDRLTGCDLWVTLEPCAMCAGAIAHARIARLYYGASDAKGGAVENGPRLFEQPTIHHRPEVYSGIGAEDASALLKAFFEERR